MALLRLFWNASLLEIFSVFNFWTLLTQSLCHNHSTFLLFGMQLLPIANAWKKSLRFSISVIEHHDKKKWGKTSVYFSLHDLIMVHHGRKLGKKLKAGTWRQKMKYWHCIAGFIAMACPASSLASRGTSPYDPGHPTSIINQRKRPSGWRHFSIGIPHFPENYN